ncbi:MAG TPA: hypothetical protein VGQ57_20290 [Polyangiaceae bacterium]|jgi:hypothetical protein|nr:hypothetical protein [Polyangiaceae bacterium]
MTRRSSPWFDAAPAVLVARLARVSLATLLVACSSPAGQPGSVEIRISGEAAATGGFLFPKGSDVTFRDGWELAFSHVLVTVADVTLSEDPDRAPSDQSQTGAVVARVSGPWAVDLAVPGPLAAVGGEGTATALARIDAENQRNGAELAHDARYAFGYRIVPARAEAARVNFTSDGESEAAYERMLAAGTTLLFVGTATFRGEHCRTSDPSYDFRALPASVPFELGFATPARYLNCQNQQNQGDAFQGEEYQRGLAVPVNQPAVAELTLHLEHPFFADTVHDTPVYFDQFAAALRDAGSGVALEAEDLAALDPTAFVDARGVALPWRSCLDDGDLPQGSQRGFGVGHVLVDRAGAPSDVFRNYLDFAAYLESTLGHLNGGEGLCYVARDYPSPR